MRAHSPINIKRFPWRVCSACGLIFLKNAVTAKAAAKECPGEFREHCFVVQR